MFDSTDAVLATTRGFCAEAPPNIFLPILRPSVISCRGVRNVPPVFQDQARLLPAAS